MSSNHQPDDREQNEARLTAFALGELRGDELAEVSRFIDENPDARRLVEEIRELAAALTLPGARRTPHAPREEEDHGERDEYKTRPILRAIEAELAKEATPMNATQPTVQPKKRDYRRIIAWSVVATTACVLAIGLILPAVQPVREAARSSEPRTEAAQATTATRIHGVDREKEVKLDGMMRRFDSLMDEGRHLEAERAAAQESRAMLETERIAITVERDALRRADPKSAAGSSLTPGDPCPAPVNNPNFGYFESRWRDLPAEISQTQVTRERLRSDEASLAPADPRMQPFEGATREKGLLEYGTEQYEQLVENRFKPAEKQPLSTFSIDVDTASYANIRRFLTQGQLPPPAAVRIEEMVNYFRYDYSPPTGRTPFAVHLEAAECPWNGKHQLVRIGLKGKEIAAQERGPSNLVFLLDVSGSMTSEDKLPLVKQAMSMLVDQLTEDDHVAIVTYASGSGIRLHPTNGTEKSKIRGAIESLYARGSTHGSAGIQDAYNLAVQKFIKGGVNRVIWATDGDLNVGVTGDDELVTLITEKAKTGVFLTVLGVGTGNLKDAKLEKMADKGNGVYAYLDSVREAQKVLVEQMTGSLVTIAKDVKIQVEFNPAEVQAYRLVGYENRVMANKDFRDDKKDAGEIGAGHTVTALYEVIPAGVKPQVGDGETLKYQQTKPSREPSDAAKSGELLTVRLRYKEPDGDEATEIEFALKDSEKRFGAASPDFRFAAAVAAFGLILRNSEYRGDLTLAAVEEFAAGAVGKDPSGYRAEFVDLVKRARQLGGR